MSLFLLCAILGHRSGVAAPPSDGVELSDRARRAQADTFTDQEPVFRSSSELVEVDVVVTRSGGQFVDDLAPGDFDISEDGVPQSVQVLYLVDGQRDAQAPAAGPLARTAVERVTGAPRVFVWLLDREHLSPGSFRIAHTAVRSFIADQLRDGDIGGIIMPGVEGGRLTSDHRALAAALDRATPASNSGSRQTMELRSWPQFLSEAEALRVERREPHVIEAVSRRATADEPVMCARVDCESVVIEKAQQIAGAARAAAARTRSALEAALLGLARMEGRKALVLITEGFVLEGLGAGLQRLVGATARARVTIYSVDARGLDRRATGDVMRELSADPGTAPSLPIDATAADDVPNALALDSGGFVIRSANRLDRGLQEIAGDIGTYYVLGYKPHNQALDGSFRRIHVRVRRPGVSVRARAGYVADPAAPTFSVRVARASGMNAAGESSASGPSSARPDALEPPAPLLAAAPSHWPDAAPHVGTLPSRPALAAEPDASTPEAVRMRPDAVNRIQDLQSRHPQADPAAAGLDRLHPQARLGWELYRQGDLEAARRAFLAASGSSPPWVSYALGWTEFALSRYEQAARAWEQVRAAAPEFDAVYFNLADSYLQLQQHGRAIDVLREAERRWPANTEVFNAIGVIQTRRGALEDAIASFTRVIALSRADQAGHFNLARAYELRYVRSRRAARNARAGWIANDEDRRRAIEHYRECVDIGGPLDDSARESLERLAWSQ